MSNEEDIELRKFMERMKHHDELAKISEVQVTNATKSKAEGSESKVIEAKKHKAIRRSQRLHDKCPH